MAQKFILLFVLWLVVAIFTTSARATGNSTTAAAGNSTTAATGNSTTAATGNSTTAAPSNSTTAAAGYSTTAPAGNSTTAAAGNSTTAAGSNSTTAAAGNSTTAATGNSTTATPTTQFKDPCNSNPCGTGSTCEVRYNDTYVCLCLAGDFYNNVSKSCERSKVFPGKLQLNKDFNEKMRDRTSKEFKETADTIIAEVDNVYNGKNGYFGCIVLKLLPSTTSRSRNTALKADAVVDITFKASAEIKEADVIQALKECRKCNTIGKTFETKNLCDDTPCDEKNTNCTSSDGIFSCTCKEGYMQTTYSTRMCIACPLGEKLKDNLCVKCSFGYSGFNCSENWQLILVIVGSVLGGLLLIAIILLPVVATQKSNKISKKSKSAEMEKPYTGLSSATQPMASNKLGHSQGLSFNRSANGDSGFQNDGVSMFPRAGNPTNSMDNRTNLEMKPSNGRQNLGHMNSGSEYSSRIYDEPEDIRPYAQTRPQNNPYAENQPRMNPYTQNQPRMNPYTQNQGHSNPYYTHDDGRRYY